MDAFIRNFVRILIAGVAAAWLAACEEERTGGEPVNRDMAEQDAEREEGADAGGPATTPQQRQLEDRAYRTQGQSF